MSNKWKIRFESDRKPMIKILEQPDSIVRGCRRIAVNESVKVHICSASWPDIYHEGDWLHLYILGTEFPERNRCLYFCNVSEIMRSLIALKEIAPVEIVNGRIYICSR